MTKLKSIMSHLDDIWIHFIVYTGTYREVNNLNSKGVHVNNEEIK